MKFSDEVLSTLAAAEPLVHYYLMHTVIEWHPPEEATPYLILGALPSHGLHIDASSDIRELPVRQQVGLLLSEYLRLLLRHLDKRSRSHFSDSCLATTAQQMAINPLVARQFELPKSAVMPNSRGYDLPLYQSAEFYFTELMKDQGRAEDAFPDWDGSTDLFSQHLLADLAEKFEIERPNTQTGTLASAIGSPQIIQKIRADRDVDFWFDVVYGFSQDAQRANQTVSWKHPSRRIADYPLGRKTELRHTVPVILDTSASMTPWLSRSVKALQAEVDCDLLVVQCDAALTKTEEFVDSLEFEIVGGGGTDLQPAFDWVQERGFSHCFCISDQEFVKQPDTHGLQVKWWNPKTGETR